MKKRGYTLIELVAVMAIICILASIVGGTSNLFSNVKNTIELESVTYEIRQLLSLSKKYCRKNSISGYINIEENGNEIRFYESEMVKEISIPKNVRISRNYNIIIDESGYIKTATTIVIMGENRKYKEITIGVGNDIISIK